MFAEYLLPIRYSTNITFHLHEKRAVIPVSVRRPIHLGLLGTLKVLHPRRTQDSWSPYILGGEDAESQRH